MLLQFLAAWKLLVRAKSFQAVFILSLVTIGAAWVGSNFSGRQQDVVFFDLSHSLARVGFLLLSVVWVLELLSKEIDRKSIHFQLSFPCSRSTFLLARYAALSLLLLVGLIVVFCLALATAPLLGRTFPGSESGILGFVISLAGLWLELSIVAAFTLLVASVATSLALPLIVGMGFAVAGRLIGHVEAYLSSGADGDDVLVSQFSGPISLIRYLLPDFATLDFRTWYLYGNLPEISAVLIAVATAVSYWVALLALNIVVFERRQFL